MNHIISRLLIYGDLPEDSILMKVGGIVKAARENTAPKDELVAESFRQVKRILRVSTDFGFDRNLWQCVLTFMLITDENPFTLTCEKIGAGHGSVNEFALNDFRAFRELFHYSFDWLEEYLGVDCFSRICHYTAIEKPELMYNKTVSLRVQELSKQLDEAKDEYEFFDLVTGFYKDYGVGLFGLNRAFRISHDKHGDLVFNAISNMDTVMLSDLVGYEAQKKKLVDNTSAFVRGKKANNVLLFGDAGTGKSTSVKAIVNEFYPQGLRMIEITRHQFADLAAVIAAIKNRNYRFVIYMDDLSFEEFETEYKYLKAVIEGGVETKPENVLIYATSNRRHLIRETWSDRDDVVNDNGMHKSDTMEEKLSLANRFGVTIYYPKPAPKEFYDIVYALAEKAGIQISRETLKVEANKWELSHGGISGRTAEQFITYLGSQEGLE